MKKMILALCLAISGSLYSTFAQAQIKQINSPVRIVDLDLNTCSSKIRSIWTKGGVTSAPCDPIRIIKIFKLNSNQSKTTSDCTTKGGTVFYGTIQNPNLNGFNGGTIYVNGKLTDEASFNKAKYGITTSSPKFDCKKGVSVSAPGISWSKAASFTLPPNYAPGSLMVKLVGGGGGGSGSGTSGGGHGGGAGALKTTSLPGAPNAACTVVIGSGGSGGSTDFGCNQWPQGTGSGGTTSISCASSGGNASAAGGTPGGQCGGSSAGTAGANSPLSGVGGGTSGGCSMGGSGSYYGAGGGGGSTVGATCGAHSGGSGHKGYAEASWKIFQWQNFIP